MRAEPFDISPLCCQSEKGFHALKWPACFRVQEDQAEREDFGVSQADTPVSEGDRDAEFAASPMPDMGTATVTSTNTDEDNAPLGGDEGIDWDGDGSTEMSPDDGEWGVDAKARTNNQDEGDDADASELFHSVVMVEGGKPPLALLDPQAKTRRNSRSR